MMVFRCRLAVPPCCAAAERISIRRSTQRMLFTSAFLEKLSQNIYLLFQDLCLSVKPLVSMSRPPLTREDAQKLVAQVRKENGGISPEDEVLLKTNFPDVLEALQHVRRKLGSATKTYVNTRVSEAATSHC